jgi:uncharacterized protein YutE (UPF0331/DUF86 family)
MVDRDVVFGKVAIIKRCLQRIKDVTRLDPKSLDAIDAQEIFILNLQRAAQAAIDLAAHLVASEGLGVPQDLRDSFRLLQEARVIAPALVEKMQKMVGFRNIAVHEYETLDLAVLKAILVNNLRDLEEYYTALTKHYGLEG